MANGKILKFDKKIYFFLLSNIIASIHIYVSKKYRKIVNKKLLILGKALLH